MKLVDILGWIGMVGIVGAYATVALQRWHVRSVINQTVNIIASVFLATNCIVYQAWIPMVLNVVWALVAIKTLVTLRRPVSS